MVGIFDDGGLVELDDIEQIDIIRRDYFYFGVLEHPLHKLFIQLLNLLYLSVI